MKNDQRYSYNTNNTMKRQILLERFSGLIIYAYTIVYGCEKEGMHERVGGWVSERASERERERARERE